MAADTVANMNKRELNALLAQYAEQNPEVTRLHSKLNAVEGLYAKIARQVFAVEKKVASLTDTAIMRDEAVEGTDKLSAHHAARIRCGDAYK